MEKRVFRLPIAFHPGRTLEEKLDEMGMGVAEFVKLISVSEQIVCAVIEGTASVDDELAASFESVTNIPAHFWLNKQRNYDEFISRSDRKETLNGSVAMAAPAV